MKNAKFKFNFKKSMIFWFLNFFLQNTYLHLMEHPCSKERSLGDAGTYNSVPVPKHLAMKT